MGLSDGELKVRMMKKAEAVIEEMLGVKKAASAITLSEIEQAVQGAGEEIKQALTEELVEQVSRQAPGVPGPGCAR